MAVSTEDPATPPSSLYFFMLYIAIHVMYRRYSTTGAAGEGQPALQTHTAVCREQEICEREQTHFSRKDCHR